MVGKLKKSAEEMLERAKTQLVQFQPFFGSLLLNLRFELSKKIATVATDGERVVANPNFVKSLSIAELQFVLAHEVCHIALSHFARRGSRDAEVWNYAADYAVNSYLMVSKVGKMLELVLHKKRYNDVKKYSSERIYNELVKNREKPLQGAQFDDHSAWPSDPARQHQIEGMWKDSIARAVIVARMQGEMPLGEDLFIDQIHPKMNWRQVLWNFVNQTARFDYRWLPPNKKHLDNGFVLPSLNSPSAVFVVAVDTSASISHEELTTFVGEVVSISAQFNAELHLLCCDAKVQSMSHVEAGEQLDVNQIVLKGGGGTSFIPVFDYILENGIQPSALIYLTDGWGEYPSEAPGYPVLWALTSNDQTARDESATEIHPPFGMTIELEA